MVLVGFLDLESSGLVLIKFIEIDLFDCINFWRIEF